MGALGIRRRADVADEGNMKHINLILTVLVGIFLGVAGVNVANSWEAWAVIGLCALNGMGWVIKE
jgi:hypothetical protein